MKLRHLFVLLVGASALSSCGETGEQQEFANWRSRNEQFIDSIAGAANCDITPAEAVEGDLFRILSTKVDPGKEWGSDKYVYCKVVTKGTDSISPLCTDSVLINYRGRLLPSLSYPEGKIFDQSYKTAHIDPAINVPSAFLMSGLVTGMTTALQYMVRGDIWRIYVPYGLGYGTESTGSNIPGHSTLIFDVNLVGFASAGETLKR